MKIALKIKAIIGIIVALLLGIVCLFDYFSINIDSSEYEMIYHISKDSSYWRFQSIENFKIWNVIQISLCSIYILLNIFFLIKEGKYIKYVLLAVESLVIILIILQILLWYGSGFDH